VLINFAMQMENFALSPNIFLTTLLIKRLFRSGKFSVR